MQINDDPHHPDGLQPKTSAGGLYDLIGPSRRDVLKPTGEFNHVRLVSRGGHIEHWLNGVKSAQCDKGSPAYKRALAASKYHVIKDFAANGPTALALQDHGEEVAYRNLKVREIHGK